MFICCNRAELNMSFGSLIATVSKFNMEDQSYHLNEGGGGRPGDLSAPFLIAAIFLSPTIFAAASILATSSSSSGGRIVLASLWMDSCHRKNFMRHFDIHNQLIHTWYSTSRFCKQWCLRPTFAFSASFSLNPRTSCQQAKVYKWSIIYSN